MIPIPTEPSFCFITPTQYAGRFATKSRTHLVLAHLVAQDPEYAHFYKMRSDEGDFVMCDNSAYEFKEAWSPELLIELGHKCGAHALVLPDYPFQEAQVTIDAAEEFIPLFKKEGFLPFFVPQSKRGDLKDWFRAYIYGAKHPDIKILGMSILGIPNALPNVDPSFARVVMSQLLLEKGIFASDKAHHFLGLNSGPGLEIPSLLRMGVLTTIDSSGPVWHAILGHEYTENCESFQAVRKCNMPVQFNYPMTHDQATLRRIETNVDLTNKIFNNYASAASWFA